MSTYYNKYQKYKKKYLDLKYKNFGCDKLEGPFPEYLTNLFEKNTIFFEKKVHDNSDYRIKKMLDCSINQIIHSRIFEDIDMTDTDNVVLIDGTNLMRNKWFVTLALAIANEKDTEIIKRSFSRYVEGNIDHIPFNDEIKWFKNTITYIIGKLTQYKNNIYIVCIQKTDNDTYTKNKLNNDVIYWLPIDCFSYINNEQILCIRDATFKFKNEADDFALILLYLCFYYSPSHKSNRYNTYILSGDKYDWFTGIEPNRLTINITNNKNQKKILDYSLVLQKEGKPVNNIISYKLYHNGIVYDNENSNFDIYYEHLMHT